MSLRAGARATEDSGDDQYDDGNDGGGDDSNAADDDSGKTDDGDDHVDDDGDDDGNTDDGGDDESSADDDGGARDDGAADDADDGGSGSTSICSDDATCPTPRYYESDTLLGECTSLEDCTGLDDYERLFFHPVVEWTAMNFSVRLNFNDDSCEQDIFYFCHVRPYPSACNIHAETYEIHNSFPHPNLRHFIPSQIHQFMSGRIKLLRDGVPISDTDVPEIPYEYDQPGEFDSTCGTYGLDAYQLPNSQCPVQFVCGADDGGGNGTASSDALAQSAKCYDAFNCAMMAGMTTRAESGSELALFIHQYVQ